MNNEIVLLDLFSGIGGFGLGLSQAGFNIQTHLYSEIDKHAIAIYKYQFKNSVYVGDVITLDGRTITRPNIITFGSPCQDFSVAGKRAGMGGQRSSLIGEAIRLIAECEPDIFIWENVKGVFSSNDGRDFWAVIQTLANIGGYRLEWQLLNTAWFLPQNRERIYLIGYSTKCKRGLGQVFPIEQCNRENDGEYGTKDTKFKIVAQRGREEKCLTPKRTEHGKNIRKDYERGVIKEQRKNIQQLEPRDDGITNTLTGVQKDNLLIIGNVGNGHETQNVYNPDGIAPTVRENHGKITKVQVADWRDDEGLRIRKDGNSPTINARAREDKCGVPMVIANTVTPDAYLARGERNRDENGKTVLTSMHDRRIRRLTPIECERLQGFPDNWTEYGDYDGVIKRVADTQRYKTLGNAVTVCVVREIGKRLLKT